VRKDEVQGPVKAEISCSYLLLAGIYQRNKLEELPFEEGKLFMVEYYLEAVGMTPLEWTTL